MNAIAAFALISTLVLASCPAGPSSSRVPSTPDTLSEDTIHQITIRTATGWLLKIDTNGSGSVGYGSSAQDFARFPQGTFDFALVRDRLLPQSGAAGTIRKDFAVAFARAGEISTTARYVSDSETIRVLFERAVASADKTGTRVGELYAALPPVQDQNVPSKSQ